MDAGLKQRLIGAAVLVALAVIFLPMLVKGPAPDSGVSDLSMRVPDAPSDYRTIDLPLVVPADAPQGGVLGTPEPVEGDPLPTVDTATAPRSEPAPDDDDAAELAAAPAATAPAQAPAPAPAATEPKLPPTAAGGDYAVHFGAFANERDAQLVVRQLSEAGLAAYSEAFTLNDKPAQRVRLGPYASREAAEAVRVRAAQVRNDVTPRVVALDAPVASTPPPATPVPAAAKPAETPRSATTPKPTETPAAPPPATADVGFAVQVGAFGNAAEAQKLRDRLRELGITAFTDTVATDKGRLTRVKAGPVPTRQDAERLKAQVKSKTGIDGMVRSHP